MFEKLKERPTNGTPSMFVTIHEGIGGWNSAVWGWEFETGMTTGGFYQPMSSGNTNTLGGGTRDEAVEEATCWAMGDDLPLWIPPSNPPVRQVMFGCGTEKAPSSFAMWGGPVPEERFALEARGTSTKDVVVRFNADGTDEVLYRWSGRQWACMKKGHVAP